MHLHECALPILKPRQATPALVFPFTRTEDSTTVTTLQKCCPIRNHIRTMEDFWHQCNAASSLDLQAKKA